MPYHRSADSIDEKHRGGASIGTTGRGIGPAYADKVARKGIRMCDIIDRDALVEKVEQGLASWRQIYDRGSPTPLFDQDGIVKRYSEHADFFRPMIRNTSRFLNESIDSGKKVLLEGAQGVLLDIDFGTYPYVTSSHTVTGGFSIGSGIPPTRVRELIGVVKAYTTRVGEGPFPTELFGETGEFLRESGREVGTTTGRPRRCGWLDLVLLKHSIMVGGFTSLAITKIDVLGELAEVKVCTHYDIDGEITDEFPASVRNLRKAKPVYTTLNGGFALDGETREMLRNGNREIMSPNMRDYLDFMERSLGVPIRIVSFGPERHDTLFLK